MTKDHKSRTILCTGAHPDDCIFGIPGIMLQAVKRGIRVVNLSLTGTSKSARDLIAFSADMGIELRCLDMPCMEVSTEESKAVGQVIAEYEFDTAFLMWPYDHHHQHPVASELCRASLFMGYRVAGKAVVPRQVFYYDNGPAHTLGFEPDTFVDITEEWDEVERWIRDGLKSPQYVESKSVLSRYRAIGCAGIRQGGYAEALQAVNHVATDIFA